MQLAKESEVKNAKKQNKTKNGSSDWVRISAMARDTVNRKQTHILECELYFKELVLFYFWFWVHTHWYLGYSWLCRNQFQQAGGRAYWMPGIEPESAACEANALPTVLFVFICSEVTPGSKDAEELNCSPTTVPLPWPLPAVLSLWPQKNFF